MLVRKDGLALKLERDELLLPFRAVDSWSQQGKKGSSLCAWGRHREGRRAERRNMGKGSPPGKERSSEARFGAGGLQANAQLPAAPSGAPLLHPGVPSSTPGPTVPPGAELCSGWVLVGLPLACRALRSSPQHRAVSQGLPASSNTPLPLILHSHSSFLASTYCAEGRGRWVGVTNYRRLKTLAWADSEQMPRDGPGRKKRCSDWLSFLPASQEVGLVPTGWGDAPEPAR